MRSATASATRDIGIGKPMLKVITDPVETQVRDFYYRRIEKVSGRETCQTWSEPTPEEIAAIRRS